MHYINFPVNLMLKHIHRITNTPNLLIIWEYHMNCSKLYMLKYFYMEKRREAKQ